MMRRPRLGFTLVELLVSLFVLALLAALSWRGLDGMVKAQQQTEARSDEVLALQIALAQWGADLDAIVDIAQLGGIEWNGRVLRLTRRGTLSAAEGVHVVGWTRREGQWLRWQSPAVTTRGELENAWQQADFWSQNAGEVLRRNEVAVTPLEEWQIFFFRENAWTNPLSSADSGAPPPQIPPAMEAGIPLGTSKIPDGVRLVLRLPPGRALSGQLVRDWVRPA